MQELKQKYELESELTRPGLTQGSPAADMDRGLEGWLQEQYLQLQEGGQDVARDQSSLLEAGGGQTFTAFKSANAEKHELQMLSAQLHFNWQNEKAKRQELTQACARLLVENRRLKKERASTAACTHEGHHSREESLGRPEKVDQCIQVDIPTREVETLQQQLADVQQRVQHMVTVSNARMALQKQAKEAHSETFNDIWPCEDALQTQEDFDQDDRSLSGTIHEQLDRLLLQMQPQHSYQLTQPEQSTPTHAYPLSMDLHMDLHTIAEDEAEGTVAPPAAAAPLDSYPLNIPPFSNAYSNPLAWMSPKSSPKQLGADSSQALAAWASQPAADSLHPDAFIPQAMAQSGPSPSQYVATSSLPRFVPLSPEDLAAFREELLSRNTAAGSEASAHLKAVLSKQLPATHPPPAASVLSPPTSVGESPMAANGLAAAAPAALSEACDSECSMQQGWVQLDLVSLGSDGSGLLQQGSSSTAQGGEGATEEQEVLAFLNSSANGSTKAPSRHSQNSDDELAPVAGDLWSRLTQANSTIKSLQGEVASLQAQNSLLRQQVELQQSQLDEGGRAWAGEAAGGLAEEFADECADGFAQGYAEGFVEECADE